jgi:dTMP kinase
VSDRGRFLVFEGVDGCGKSTQVARVADARGALATREPGGTAAGLALRDVVLDPEVPMSALTEVLVMAADRAQHVAELIEPALAAGRDVVCDRYNGSTLAYQGYGRGVPLDGIRAVLAAATRGVVPDATILLDCPPEVALARGRGVQDRFEAEDAAFAARVRKGFLDLARDDPTWCVVDAARPLVDVSGDVDAIVAAVLG